MEPRLVAIGKVMMICAGKLGCRVFDRGMLAGGRIGGVQGARPCGAVICQGGAVTAQSGAARTGCRGVTAQSRTPAATHMSASAGTTAGAAATATAVVAAPARCSAGR